MIKKSSLILFFILLLAACSNTNQVAPNQTIETPVLLPSSTAEPTIATKEIEKELTSTPEIQETEEQEVKEPTVTVSPDDRPPSGATSEFTTDFSIHSIPYTEIRSGGPKKDGIPAIDSPKFTNVEEADEWLADEEPVILIQVGEHNRAYPLQILTWHEIVNDVVGDTPLTITFCPLCNTAVAFERTVNGEVLDFGTTGRLRYSNLVMYDRQTETWWQQAGGNAIVGELTGTQLILFPAALIPWSDFKEYYPSGLVLSTDTGHSRPYGTNPYIGYDNINNYPFLYDGPTTPVELRPIERVLLVELNGESVTYPYLVLEELHVIQDEIGGVEIVIIWESGTVSALDTEAIKFSRDVGTANVYERMVDDNMLDFEFDGENVIDTLTNSTWNTLGFATEGELAGTQLNPVVSINHFWFSAAAFSPGTSVFGQE
jgi:hypothetical protein